MKNNEQKKCILYDNKICDRCGECDMCDLDPNKVCDNCEKCLHMDDEDYNMLELDMHMETDDESVLEDPEIFRQMSGDEDDWLSDFYRGNDEDDDLFADDFDEEDEYGDEY